MKDFKIHDSTHCLTKLYIKTAVSVLHYVIALNCVRYNLSNKKIFLLIWKFNTAILITTKLFKFKAYAIY